MYEIAESKNLVLMVPLKTAYCPAFGHLVTLLKSGAIGEVVEVSASIGGQMNEQACFPLLPIFKLLGTEYRDLNFYTKIENGIDIYTKALFRYDSAVALFQLGLGAKSEGNLVISGTKGYAYIPAPWWKTDYYEIRYEDPDQNKKYFYPFAGEGLRYEIKEFVSAILADGHSYSKIAKKENLAMAQVQEAYLKGTHLFKL